MSIWQRPAAMRNREQPSDRRLKLAVKKAVMGVAVVLTLGASAASADTLDFSYSGLFTMLGPNGKDIIGNTSSPYYYDSTWSGLRTPITGAISFNTATGAGTGTMVPFDFFNGTTPVTAVSMNFQTIGDGFGNPGTLLLGNMLFNWSDVIGIPVSIVMDAQGLFGAMALSGFGVGSVVSGVGALPATDGIDFGKIKIGAAPIAATTWNTSLNGLAVMGNANSGALPLIADPFGGSPMIAGPFPGFVPNFDITSMTVLDFSLDPVPTPLPAAAWLLGSGLVGLVGMGRRRRREISEKI